MLSRIDRGAIIGKYLIHTHSKLADVWSLRIMLRIPPKMKSGPKELPAIAEFGVEEEIWETNYKQLQTTAIR